MSEQRPRLLIRPGGVSLDSDQMKWLQDHFEVVESGEAEASIAEASADADRLAQVRAAGEEMIHLSADQVRELNAVDRLKRIEQIAARVVRDTMGFKHFEVRLINADTQQLEIVIAIGIDPLGVGQRLYARREKNGISGYVATTGETYVCDDVAADPHYTTGIEGALSSLTSPLKLDGETIGVMNIESRRPSAFGPDEVAAAELFAGYLAVALHILNLLVAERAATRSTVAARLRDEVDPELRETEEAAAALRALHSDDQRTCRRCDAISNHIAAIRRRIDECERGTSSVIGVEGSIAYCEESPEFQGRHVLVVDDDPQILKNVADILACAGCRVTTRSNAADAFAEIERDDSTIEAVISDVKLPDLTGFEVYTHIHDHHPGISVILMTGFGYDPHHSIVRASQQGLDSILFKPFKAKQLLDELRRAIGERERG